MTAGLGSRQAGTDHFGRCVALGAVSCLCLRPDKRKEEAGEGGRKGEEKRRGEESEQPQNREEAEEGEGEEEEPNLGAEQRDFFG